ncbi:MAG: hypothetical protein ACK4YP_15855 [Myxococcota bacterium]
MPSTVPRIARLLALGLLAGGAAYAATSYGVTAVIDETGLLEVTTSAMDRGWFTRSGTFDRAKTDVSAEYTLGATTCSDAGAGGSLSSVTSGTFLPVYNRAGTAVVGYQWDVVLDLSGAANRWYNHTHCDGSVEVHGCAAAIPVSIQSAVDAASGECRTLDDGTCAAATTSASLPAVQDPDVVETDCGGTCDIGPCVSSCEADCNDAWPVGRGAPHGNAAAKAACNAECHCVCKEADPDCTVGVGECD